jgi:hypothetical protein
MPGYNSQRRGTACTLLQLVVLLCVLFVCKYVLYHCHRVAISVYCTTATGWLSMCTVPLPPGGYQYVLYHCHRVAINVYCTTATGWLSICTVPLPPGVNPIAVNKYINLSVQCSMNESKYYSKYVYAYSMGLQTAVHQVLLCSPRTHL